MPSFLSRWRSQFSGRAPANDFTELLRPHIDDLFRLAWRLTEDEQRAEDLLQDLLIKLYQRGEDLTAIEQLRPWLARILYRQYVDSWRRERNAPALMADLADDFEADHLPGAQLSPELLHNQDELQKRLAEAIKHLNNDQRDVLLLHDMQGYKLEEVSEIVQSPVGTLKSRLFRARAQLRSILAKDAGASDLGEAGKK